jgi:hypothetical protein
MTKRAGPEYSLPGFGAVAALAALLVLPAPAGAAGFVYQFDTVFGASSVAPGGAAPWLQATFADATGGVLLTLSNVSLTVTEKTEVVAFNLNPSLDPAGLTFALQSSVGSFTSPTISTGVDAFRADGDGYYDIALQFDIGGGASTTFNNGESLTYLLAGIPGLTASDFEYLSTASGGGGPFYAAAHVQGTGSGNVSAWAEPNLGPLPLPVPEPAASALLSLAAGVWFAGRFRARNAGGNTQSKRAAPRSRP